jgi:transcriptional regulator with XRE-family HTH domain
MIQSIDVANVRKTVGKRLRGLREAVPKQIDKAAVEAGIAPGLLADIEDGEAEFDITTLFRLCAVYRTPPAKLLEGVILIPPK